MCYCFVLSTVLLNLSHRSQVDFHASSAHGFGVLNFQVCHLVGFFPSFFILSGVFVYLAHLLTLFPVMKYSVE